MSNPPEWTDVESSRSTPDSERHRVTEGDNNCKFCGSSLKTYFTKQEYAEHMSVSERTVERWIERGLPHLRRGRVIRIPWDKAETWQKLNTIGG